MSKFLPCKLVCPVVSSKDREIERLEAEIAALTRELARADNSLRLTREGLEECQRRIAKGRQALFGVLDQPKIVGGP